MIVSVTVSPGRFCAIRRERSFSPTSSVPSTATTVSPPVRTGGDTVVAVDGEELVGENDLSRLIAQKRPGDTVTLTIIRDGEEQEVEVELGARPTG